MHSVAELFSEIYNRLSLFQLTAILKDYETTSIVLVFIAITLSIVFNSALNMTVIV